MPQDFNETLALTTALGYSLLACETCVLSCCFDSVSMSSRQEAFMDLVPVCVDRRLCWLQWFLSDVASLMADEAFSRHD